MVGLLAAIVAVSDVVQESDNGCDGAWLKVITVWDTRYTLACLLRSHFFSHPHAEALGAIGASGPSARDLPVHRSLG